MFLFTQSSELFSGFSLHSGVLWPTESISETITWSNFQISTISDLCVSEAINSVSVSLWTSLNTSSNINPTSWTSGVEVEQVETGCGIDTTFVSTTVIRWDDVCEITIAKAVEGCVNTSTSKDDE
jgi:hypothetical protein